jgi:hypothetical protein
VLVAGCRHFLPLLEFFSSAMSKKYVPPHRRQAAAPSVGQSRWREAIDNTETSASEINKRNATFNRPSQQSSRFGNVRLQSRPSHKIMFLGDSFVRLFGLLQHPEVFVKAFKGASAKGLGRDGNPNRETIRRQVQQQQPDRIIFVFGNVDVHLSYYFTKYAKDGPTIDLKQVAETYVAFAASLLAVTKNIHILGVYPSPLEQKFVVPSLEAYGAISAGTSILEDDMTIEGRQSRVQDFNNILRAACAKNGLIFEDAYTNLVDADTHALKHSFRDVSPYNIHIVWETTILMWMEKWPWFKELADPGFSERIQKTWEEYLATKPWADNDHNATNIGVGEAFDITKTET